MNKLLPEAILESEDRRDRFRMFAKRPTIVAAECDAHVDLHVQVPAVKHLSWEVADSLMRTGANDCDEQVWFTATAVYRDEEIAEKVFQSRRVDFDISSDALLFGDDLQLLIDANFAIPTHLTVQQFESQHSNQYAYVKLFAALENRNNKDRRRVISWPKSLNEAEKLIKRFLESMHFVVRFCPASEVRDRGVKFDHSASIDFKKFYQQFALLVKRYWAFKSNNMVYLLATIPTGAVLPPLFCQALSRTILSLAIRSSNTEKFVESDCCIDNLRLCSDNLHALWAAWHQLLAICDSLGATIGDINAPPMTTQSPYTYLGMLFSTINRMSSVELSAKSNIKVMRAISLIESRCDMLVVDAIALFGQTVWAATVTDYPLGNFYYVIKFIRRIQRRSMHDTIRIWESIIDPWTSHLRKIMSTKFHAQEKPNVKVTMFTDASESGYGIVILDFGDRPIRIFGGRWTDEEKLLSINLLELKAFRIGIRILTKLKSCDDIISLAGFIDNTTARAWTLKRRAPSFTANEVSMQIDGELKQSKIILESLDYVNTLRNIADKPSRRFE